MLSGPRDHSVISRTPSTSSSLEFNPATSPTPSTTTLAGGIAPNSLVNPADATSSELALPRTAADAVSIMSAYRPIENDSAEDEPTRSSVPHQLSSSGCFSNLTTSKPVKKLVQGTKRKVKKILGKGKDPKPGPPDPAEGTLPDDPDELDDWDSAYDLGDDSDDDPAYESARMEDSGAAIRRPRENPFMAWR